MIEASQSTPEEWARHLDETVAEIFATMLAIECAAVDASGELRADLAASVDLSGALVARCEVSMPASSARRLASIFLGDSGVDEAMAADAVGELCNIIAGGWKRQLGDDARLADLSVPTVISLGADDRIDEEGSRVCRAYTFGTEWLAVRLKAG